MAKVAVLGLGGTIAMTRTPAGGVAPALSAAELVAASLACRRSARTSRSWTYDASPVPH